jgi:glycosyltransferase involved in cell wall biosynthesis
MKSRHIVFICEELPPAPGGGVGTFVADLAPALSALGQKVTILGAYGKDHGWDRSRFRIYDVAKSYSTPSIAKRAARRLVRLVPEISERNRWRIIEEWTHEFHEGIARLHREESIDVVEWHSNSGFYKQRVPGVVDVVRLHGSHFVAGNYMGEPVPIEVLNSETRTMRGIHNWIGVSEWSLRSHEEAFAVRPRRSTVILNPTDCALFKPVPARGDELDVLYVGTLCDDKGDVRVARAANVFLKKFPRSRLTYIGREAGERVKLIYAALDPDLHARVTLTGALSRVEVARRLQHAALMLLPSRSETFGMVYAEAMACGLPVVGGDLTAVPEVVPHGKAGLLVDPENVEQITDAVCRLLENRELREEYGRYGREFALANFSLETCARRSLDFYETCLQAEAPERVAAPLRAAV